MRYASGLRVGEALLGRARLFDRVRLHAPGLVKLIDCSDGRGVELRLKELRHFRDGGETRDPIPRLAELAGDIGLLLPASSRATTKAAISLAARSSRWMFSMIWA